ncbi:MAG: EAL domain-containing protein [Rhodoferax sp.]|nr:EAL domain-containing protein [Rhodoferax sp.]
MRLSLHTNRFRQGALVAGLFILLCIASAWWIWDARRDSVNDARDLVSQLANDQAQGWQRAIERSLSATYAVAALVRRGQGQVPDFEPIATEMLAFYPGIAALGLSPDGVVQQVVPQAGNERLVGYDQLGNATQARETSTARDSHQLTLIGPLKLVQGGTGVVGLLPIFLNDPHSAPKFWGFSFVTLRFPQVLDVANRALINERGYAYELWRTHPDSGERQVIDAADGGGLMDPVNAVFELPNGQWTLSVSPRGGWQAAQNLWAQLGAALLLSGLVSYLAWVLFEMRGRDQRLEAEVADRTSEILATQYQLKATIAAIPDAMFVMNLEGRYLSCQSPDDEYLARPMAQLLGATVSEVMPPESAAIVMSALKEAHENSRSTGKQFKLPLASGEHWFELSISRKSGEPEDEPRFVVLSRNVTQNKKAEERIRLLAHFDPLTRLPNRVMLTDRCQQALASAHRTGQPLALFFLDLDHFKNINDSLGHAVGDQLLVAFAERLQAEVRDRDTVSRLGGDEFVLLLPDTDMKGAAHMAEKLLKSAQQPLQLALHELTVSPSIGIAMYPADGLLFEDLSRCADAAMYRAKHDGRNGYRFFTSEMQSQSERTLAIENGLRKALARQQFSLCYQPQVCLKKRSVSGAEVLLRWTHPELGVVTPAEFIPIAESCGLILPVGEWVLRTASQQWSDWMAAGMAPLTLSVNLSSVQFRQADLPERVSAILWEARMPPDLLELELTEGTAMANPESAVAVMNDLHARGIRMSIDDFGTGYSSLSYLKKFKINKIKIDQSFVRDITSDPDDKAIVGAIIKMADNLNMATLAEGVETQAQLDYLREQGCNQVQGYFFSRPLPPDQFIEFVEENRNPPKP